MAPGINTVWHSLMWITRPRRTIYLAEATTIGLFQTFVNIAGEHGRGDGRAVRSFEGGAAQPTQGALRPPCSDHFKKNFKTSETSKSWIKSINGPQIFWNFCCLDLCILFFPKVSWTTYVLTIWRCQVHSNISNLKLYMFLLSMNWYQ